MSTRVLLYQMFSSTPCPTPAKDDLAGSASPSGGLAPQPGPEAVPVLQSAALMQGCKRVHIEHNGARYQLQATRQGKLILTK